MEPMFELGGAVPESPLVQCWFDDRHDPLGLLARRWFDAIRACGDDVVELLHDGQPTACVGTAAFAYVDAFSAHVNVGFFRGFALDDPARLLRGNGRRMRHVRLDPDGDIDAAALTTLIRQAHADIRRCLAAGAGKARGPTHRETP